MPGKSLSSGIHTFFDQRFLDLERSLTDGTPYPEASQSFLREIDLHYLSEMSPPNFKERILSFEVEVDTHLSYLKLTSVSS